MGGILKLSTIVTGDGGKMPGRFDAALRLVQDKKFIAIAAPVLFIVLASCMFVYFQGRSARLDREHAQAQVVVTQVVGATVLNPDYETATKELQRQLKATSDKNKKADLYVSLASIARQQGKYQPAVDNELQAIKLDASRSGLLSKEIADDYVRLGNKAAALQYYQQALAYYNGLNPNNARGREYYITTITAKIAELQK